MAKHPVVVYGASGYTGMLIMDWLIDHAIPFTAVARNAGRVKEMMAERVVRLESAIYEILEVEHTVESLAKAFKGAKVVCNTVGPFVRFGEPAMARGAASRLSLPRHERRAGTRPQCARSVRRELPAGRPLAVTVRGLSVHLCGNRRGAGARNPGDRCARDRDDLPGSPPRSGGNHRGLDCFGI